MTVKELIAKLSTVDQNLEVVIKHIDNSDWEYNLPLRDQDVFVDEVFEVDDSCLEEGQTIGYGDECLIIDFNFE